MGIHTAMTLRPLGCACVALLGVVPSLAAGQAVQTVAELAAARASQPPVIDGRLGDEVWAAATPMASFTQRDPDEGNAPTERTEVRILYDDAAIYVAARLFDNDPSAIVRRLSTRDASPDADMVSVYIDSMHDGLTGSIFRVSAANVQQDAILYNDTWTDNNWDAVWQSGVMVDDEGWCVEMRIPLSQLRFLGGDRQTWGINVERHIRRKNENDWLRMVPKSENGLASRMAPLTGLDGLHPTRRIEILPYVAARNESFASRRAVNASFDTTRALASAGVDMKLGVTNNLTLTGAINPDFGQVEVDPAVVNLSAFETFFQEKRPFFLEGAQIFGTYGRGGSNDFWGFNNSEPTIFYSRRIGRAPQLGAPSGYSDIPTATTILGAAKLTGKTSSGWSLGFLEAVTGEETARSAAGIRRGQTVVEPLTNYVAVRMQRDIGQRFGAGLLSTVVNRRLEGPAQESTLVSGAYVAGADAYFFLDRDRDWVIVGNIAGSVVQGAAAAIERLQRAPQRYFQRPDAPHVRIDPTRTSLNGFTGRLNLNRNSGLYKVNAALWTGSPGWESNDLGFHGTGDRVGAHVVFQIRDVTVRRFSRSRSAWIAKHWSWNFGRELQNDGLNYQMNWQFLNYWSVNGGGNFKWETLDDRLTRGGPSATNPSGGFWNANASSDQRQRVSINLNLNGTWSDVGAWAENLNPTLTIKPSAGVNISLGPSWNRSRTMAQYVRSVVDPTAASTYGGRYVFGTLDQKQLSMTTRVNVVLSPTVSIQVFAQPLLAAGDYFDFKELAEPRTFNFRGYGTDGSTLAFDQARRSYSIDPDGAGAAPAFAFGDPDFNLKSLRVNAVFRWEIKSGSTLYAVWTRQQQDFSNPGTFSPGRDWRAVAGAPSDDVVLFKMAYWFGR